MSCSCSIDSFDECYTEFISYSTYTARKSHICCECGIKIKPGEKYQSIAGKWDGDFSTYKVCLDCVSVRSALFCSYTFEQMWEDLSEAFSSDIWGGFNPLPPYECMSKLTKRARDMVCDLIEELWEENEKDK